jgi:hypothetical protein
VFLVAGIWGVLVITPLYFLYDSIGRPARPEFYYGFAGVTLAWQFAFLVIASAPERFRLMMIPAVFEKLSYVVMVAVLYGQNRMGADQAIFAIPDTVLGVLFAVSFFKLGR